MTRPPATDAELDRLEERIDAWLAQWQRDQGEGDQGEGDQGEGEADRPLLLDVTRDDDVPRRWYVRLAGDTRDVVAVWLTLRQRTLAYESYVLPLAGRRADEVAAFLLRRNYALVGAQFSVGPEDAYYLTGELPTHCVDEDELDRIVGSMWAYVERDFETLLEMGHGVKPRR
ncbi:MAG TPA: hypothetical protein DEP66_01065, partial [Acidimicrobiaceae bacterium]|nr:hypothetical protein [Acidimicrobiaceae bacterium]